ncbi:MAG: SH3 domain-containing protein [Myxacorys californica WJT36-NPBG1]|jgi:uncharacterized protein YraI|nr:SH3 domain-containing protein [Myxacorys californica WJT36-NPBG1]
METFAFLETAVAHEDPSPDLQVRSLKELGLTVPAAASVGLAGLLLATTLLVSVPNANALPASVTVTSSGLNIRSGPGTGYPIIGGLSSGQTVGVSDYSGGWYRISSGGWIASNYTTYSGGGGIGGGGTPIDTRVRITGSVVNVRNGPGTGYGLNGRPLYYGEVVRVVRSSGGWYQLPDGGWFSSSYATSTGSNPGTGGGGTPIDRVVTVTGSVVNVRNGPGTGYALNGRPLYYGERVRVVRSSGGWYQLTDGGWFSGSYAN